MGYFENLNTKNLNLKTDGELRYVNGGCTLVPWMESTDNDLYKGCLEELLKDQHKILCVKEHRE